jgi:RNA polymerase sigma factor (TIGR02999 family)
MDVQLEASAPGQGQRPFEPLGPLGPLGPPEPLGAGAPREPREPREPRDSGADAGLFLKVYQELYGLARREMRGQSDAHTLQPTALVNEAYLRLSADGAEWQGREHFLRVAARAMRQILVDHGRRRAAGKRPPKSRRVELDSLLETFFSNYAGRSIDLESLDTALTKLEAQDPKLAELVELHFFGGHTMEECARHFGISERQVFRWWKTARAFLHREVEQ